MKPKRYRLRNPAPLNSDCWKCGWIDCAHGMGLAGSGRCSARGEWWNTDCPHYITEEESLKRWKEEKGL